VSQTPSDAPTSLAGLPSLWLALALRAAQSSRPGPILVADSLATQSLLLGAAMDNLVDAGTRELGRSGLSVGPLAFGCWRFTHDHVRDARTALEQLADAAARSIASAE
jgi:hypothetical protein